MHTYNPDVGGTFDGGDGRGVYENDKRRIFRGSQDFHRLRLNVQNGRLSILVDSSEKKEISKKYQGEEGTSETYLPQPNYVMNRIKDGFAAISCSLSFYCSFLKRF